MSGGVLAGSFPSPRLGWLNRRAVGLVLVAVAALLFLRYLVTEVSLNEPTLSRSEATEFWLVAVIGALIVASGVLLVVTETRRAARAVPAESPAPAPESQPLVPRSLLFEMVPRWVVAIAAAISASGLIAAFVMAVPLWVGGLMFALPWLPLIGVEARWKYATYGVYAAFALLCLLQVAHMGEHSMQVGQLVVHSGDLTVSHGVFGQLDFELVHFVTDTLLWIVLGTLLIVWRGRNVWLWVAFGAASLHQVEHFYLFWLYQTHESVYQAGGFTGIMGKSGMLGSPLDRPYLHFTYNLIVVIPMLIAVWDEARRVDRENSTRFKRA